jgi:hypothetical protein
VLLLLLLLLSSCCKLQKRMHPLRCSKPAAAAAGATAAASWRAILTGLMLVWGGLTAVMSHSWVTLGVAVQVLTWKQYAAVPAAAIAGQAAVAAAAWMGGSSTQLRAQVVQLVGMAAATAWH